MIDEGIKKRQEQAVTEPLSVECIEHVSFAKNKAKVFQGRTKVIEDIKAKIVGRGNIQ